MDAPAGAFGCLGGALPTTAPDPLAVSGTAKTLNGLSTANAPGVTLGVYLTAGGGALATTTSASDGTFALSVATGGQPVAGYLKATKTGLLDYYLFPGTPLSANVNSAPVLVISSASLGTVETLASVTPATDPNAVGFVGVVVHDCDSKPVAGATISVTQSGGDVGDKRYVVGSVPSTTATMTDTSGSAFVFNVPAGTTTISAMVAGMTLRTHDIKITGNSGHATLVVP
jgi:hypothetical protein